jgi:hypothetical protein
MDYKHTLDYKANQVKVDSVPAGIRSCTEPLLCVPRDLALHGGRCIRTTTIPNGIIFLYRHKSGRR